jgi:hypothetical protein
MAVSAQNNIGVTLPNELNAVMQSHGSPYVCDSRHTLVEKLTGNITIRNIRKANVA